MTSADPDWLERAGEAELIGGYAHVALAADFAAAVDTSTYQVFTSSYDALSVFVTNRSATGFEIHALQPPRTRPSAARCAWRVIARRRSGIL
ncbi:MAG TPA: hypothetical protein VLR71_11235 [Casimicrobiaceae bacterium]|nr:hypothetical protein [Casimicrobiaceae bacterium]